MRDGYRDLWFSVIERALLDACGSSSCGSNKYASTISVSTSDARYFLKEDINRDTLLDILGIDINSFDCLINRIEENNWNKKYIRSILNKASLSIHRNNRLYNE